MFTWHPILIMDWISISFYLIAICPVPGCFNISKASLTCPLWYTGLLLASLFLTWIISFYFPWHDVILQETLVHLIDKRIPGVYLKWNMFNNSHCVYIFHSKTYFKFGFEEILQREVQYCYELWIVVFRTSLGLSTFHTVDFQCW